MNLFQNCLKKTEGLNCKRHKRRRDNMVEYSETVPIQYETGKTEFMGLDIAVDPRVFIPRPESEMLVEIVFDIVRRKGWDSPRILDMCTGSGAIAIALKKIIPGSMITAVDISSEALEVAHENTKRCLRGGEIDFVCSDLYHEIGRQEKFDIIVSNPPYVSDADYKKVDLWVSAEPKIALWSGDEGLDHLKILAEESLRYLKEDGFIALEIGYDQSSKVKDMLSENGFLDVVSYRDFNDFDRIVTANNG
jgi:release factor glutamine methyltransferase